MCTHHLMFCLSVDNMTAPQLLMAAVENDDSPLSYARAFHTAALIPDADLTDLFDQIEDIIAQADETSTTLYVRPRIAPG